MSSQDFLNGYSMVVALTQKFLNSQLAAITEPISNDPPPPTGANTDYPIANSFTVQNNPDAAEGSPEAYPAIIVNQMSAPTVAIKANGQVDFTLHIVDGVVQYFDLSNSELTESLDGVDITFTVDMTLATIEDVNDLDTTSTAIDQLQGFQPADFTIQYLVLDFESSTLISTFDVSSDAFSTGSRQYTTLLVCIKTFFTGTDDPTDNPKNPYILGYPISADNPDDSDDSDLKLLSGFVPTSCEFSTTVNSDSGALSTLNYCLMTENNPFPTDANRGIFNDPWVTDASSSGMLTISNEVFVNSYLLTQVLPQIRTALGVDQSIAVWANPHDPNTWELYQQETNSDQNDGKGPLIKVDGNLDYYLLKDYQVWSTATLSNVDGNMTITANCKFQYHQKADVQIQKTNWVEATIIQYVTLTLTYSVNDDGALIVESDVTVGNPAGADPNVVQKAGAVAAVFNSLADAFNSICGTDYQNPAEQLEADLQTVEGNLVDTFKSNIENSMDFLKAQFVLPAGDAFYYNNVAFDSEDDMQVDIAGSK